MNTSPGLIGACRNCQQQTACRKLCASHDPNSPTGYTPLGTAIPCPDGFVERVLDSELPGQVFTVPAAHCGQNRRN